MKLQQCSSPLAYLLMFSILLTVTGQKRLVVTQPEAVRAAAGESVSITCSFEIDISGYFVTWTLGCNTSGKLQDLPCFQRRVNISFTDPGQTPHSPHGEPNSKVNATITIINLTEGDSGTFCCHVKSPGMAGTGPGTRLEVTPRSIPPGRQEDQETGHEKYILYTVIGAEALVILILIAVVIKCRPRGLSRSEDQGLQSDPSELQYADICKKSYPQHLRPRINVQEVTYSGVKTKKEERDYDLH